MNKRALKSRSIIVANSKPRQLFARVMVPRSDLTQMFAVDSPEQGQAGKQFTDRDEAVMRAAIHSLDTEGPAFVYEFTEHNPRRRLCMVVEVSHVGMFAPIGGVL
jgi:hypothetical protein